MNFSRNDIEIHYCQSLLALKFIFEQTEVHYWAKWIEKDLDKWENEKSVHHHISAYGGMGSLSDLIICTQNGHGVMSEQEPWVNSLISDLRSLCYTFAISLREQKEITLDEVVNGMGRYIYKLQGWRCLSCGYSDLSLNEIENYIAYILERNGIIQAIISNNLIHYTKQTFQLDVPEAHGYRENLKKIVTDSNIVITNRIGWLRPCPKCSSEDTAIYRWEKRKKRKWLFSQEEIFKPSDDNLQMR